MHSIDFLEPQHHKRTQSLRTSWVLRFAVWIFATVLLLIIAAGGSGFFVGLSALRDVREGIALMKELDMQKASERIHSARLKAEGIRVSFAILRPAEYLPLIGAQLEAARLSVEAGVDGLVAAELLMKPVGEVINILDVPMSGQSSAVGTFRSLPPEKKRAILQSLLAASADIDRAALRLRSADDTFARIRTENLVDQLRAELDPIRIALHEARTDFDAFAPLAKLLPELLGGTEERTLLFVFQNSDELRPTGGFIGTYGIFHAKDGEFELSDIRDVYTLDRPATPFFHEVPPEPFTKYLSATGWYFRDANWSPHFPESAATLLDFYVREKGERGSELDGVLAMTPRVIGRLAALVGCMTVQEVEFCPENIIEKLQYEVEQGYDIKGITDANRKQIIAPLAAEFLRRMYSLPSSKLPDVFDILRDSFASKDVLLWSKDRELESAIEEAGIDGRVRWTSPDGFMVVDANLGGMKTDPYVKRDIRYTIENGFGTVAITYRNTAPEENWKWTTYRTWTRVYVPPGSEWIETFGSLDHDKWHNPERKEGKTVVQNELGLVSIGAFTAIDIGETRTLTFRFRLAPQVFDAIRRGDYALTVLRQPGAPNHALTLDIPFAKKLKSASPIESVRYFGDNRYQVTTDLSLDRYFEVQAP